MLTVNILNNNYYKEETAKIAHTIRKHLLCLGFCDGRWDLGIIRKTGKTKANEIEFSHRNARKFYYQIQPIDSDASWRIILHVPVFVDPSSLIEAERDSIKKGAQQMDNITKSDDIQITVGQIHKAIVSEHLEYGLKIKIGEYEGIILLADISETYDKNDLFRYPVGKTISIIVSSIDEKKKQIMCSTKIETVTSSTTNLFTGVPNKDGSLSLQGYARDLHRKYDIVERLAILCIDNPNRNVKHDVAVAHIESFFKEKYNALTLDKRGLSALLTGICQGDIAWLQKTEDGYTLTELGWETIDGQSQPALKPKPPELVEPAPEPAPEPAQVPDKKCKFTGETAILELITKPTITALSPKPPISKEIDIDIIAEYLGKGSRLHIIDQNIKALINEQEEIKKWFNSNQHLHIIADRLFMKIMREKD